MTQWVKFISWKRWYEVEDHGDKFGPLTGRSVGLPDSVMMAYSLAGEHPYRICEIATNAQKDQINLAIVRDQFRKATRC